MSLENKVAQFNQDADLAHQIIHGDGDAIVTTEGGPVRSFAKVLKDSAGFRLPTINDFESLGDTTDSVRLARWKASADANKPLLLMRPLVLGETLVMQEGLRIFAPCGELNVVTRSRVEPDAQGLVRISLAPGFNGDAIVFPGTSYDASIEGVWLDLRNQASGRGVFFSDAGYAGSTFRTMAGLRRSKVYAAAGVGIHVAPWHHEVNLQNVVVQDTRGEAATLTEGADCTYDQLWAQSSVQRGHVFRNAAAIRIGHIEAWASGQDNIVFDGFCRGIGVKRMISDIAGRHGVLFTQEAGAGFASAVRIEDLWSGGSGQSAAGTYDDLHFEVPQAALTGRSYIEIRGRVGFAYSAQPTRYGVEAVSAATNNFLRLLDIHLADFTANATAPQSGTYGPGAQKLVRIGAGCRDLELAGPVQRTAGATTGVHNLIQNGRFEAWTSNGVTLVPEGWQKFGNVTLSKETVDTFDGSPCLKVTAGAAAADAVEQYMALPQHLRGKRVSFIVRAKNPLGEATANDSILRVTAGANTEQVILQSTGRWDQYKFSVLVDPAATVIRLHAMPATTVPAAGWFILLDSIRAVEGTSVPDVLPSNPNDANAWTDITLNGGGSQALDSRFGGSRYKISADAAVTVTGIVNATPMQELLLEFQDANCTLVFFGSMRRRDGNTLAWTAPARSLVRAVWDGQYWIVDIPSRFVAQSYTRLNLPAAGTGPVDGTVVFCSDLGGGAGLVEFIGGAWRRLTHPAASVAVDADEALTYLANAAVRIYTGALTANRTKTLSTVGGVPGALWKISNQTTGGFNIIVGAKNIAPGASAEFHWTGAAWAAL